MDNLKLQLIAIIILIFSPKTTISWPWSSSSSPKPNNQKAQNTEFSLQTYTASNEALHEAKKKMSVPDTCWHNAYKALFQSCSEIMRDEGKKNRLAWMLSECFQIDSGRNRFPKCDESSRMDSCRKRLSDKENDVFLAFFLQTNNICHQLQSEAFKHETERLINDLSETAHLAEDKLEIMNQKSNQLIQDSNQIHDSLFSLQVETNQITLVSKEIESQIGDVIQSTLAIFQQSKDIAKSQLELKEAQTEMSDTVKTSMIALHESYESLGKGMDGLMKETEEIEREVKFVGETMVNKMHDLQTTANNIENVTGSSLEKQKELLDGQIVAIEGLDSLKKTHSEALKESRETLERFSEYGLKQHEELLRRQAQIQNTHDHLNETSQAILKAQREFEMKQSDIFSMIEKLYSLYKAILDESRFIKAFFFYSCVSFMLYMLTSANQTFRIRVHLYLGLIIFLLLELAIIKVWKNDDLISKIWLARYTFIAGAFIQILYSIFTYRDMDKFNNQLLQTLMEKVCILEKNAAANMYIQYEPDYDEDSLSDYSWIEDELPEDVDIKEDPNYYPDNLLEMNEASLLSKSYDLRPRNKH